MKTPTNTKANGTKRKFPPLAAIVISLIAVLGLVWGGMALIGALSSKATVNYAEEVANPLEAALAKAGGVKQCTSGDAGRGSDNDAPWYHAIYEMPGNREVTASLVSATAKEVGFALVDDSSRANAEDNRLLADRTSQRNPYTDLSEGNVVLLVTEYGSKTYTGPGDQFCTVTKRDNPPTDKTTVSITVNLPPFKR